jgi:hypothetical protein
MVKMKAAPVDQDLHGKAGYHRPIEAMGQSPWNVAVGLLEGWWDTERDAALETAAYVDWRRPSSANSNLSLRNLSAAG